MVEAFGGLKRFAELCFETFDGLPDNSPARVQLLSNLMRLMAKDTERYGDTRPTDEMSDEELMGVLAKAMGRTDEDDSDAEQI